MLQAKPLGIIDTLGEGFASLNRRLWVVLLPIALDLLLAFGPGVSSAPVNSRLVDYLTSFAQSAGDAEAQAPLLENLQEGKAELMQANLLAVLALHLPSAVTVTSLVPAIRGPVVAEVDSLPAWLVWVAVLATAGIALASVYLASLARCVRAGQGSLSAESSRTFGRMLTLYGMVLFVGVPLLVVAMLVVGLVGMLAPIMGSLLGTMLMALLMLALFYAAFTEEAIVLQGMWPVPAALASARMVYRHFWTSLGFIALVMIITTGMPVVWRMIAPDALGMLAAIVGNAYVSSGLSVAAMLFFWQRQAQPQAADAAASSLSRKA